MIGSGTSEDLPRIYLATPLTNLSAGQKRTLCAEAKNVSLTIESVTLGNRVEDEQWPVVVYAPIMITPPWGDSVSLSALEIYRTNLIELLRSDALIVLADRQASAGVGQEIEWAVRSGIPILYLSHTAVSRQIQGTPAHITFRQYSNNDGEQLEGRVTQFLQHSRAMICDGPRRRAGRELRYAKVTKQLRAALTASADPTGIALRCGVTFGYIEMMIEDPARVAVMPAHLLESLCAELRVRPPGLRVELPFRAARALALAANADGWTEDATERVRLHGIARLTETAPGGTSSGTIVDLDTLDAWREIKASIPPTQTGE